MPFVWVKNLLKEFYNSLWHIFGEHLYKPKFPNEILSRLHVDLRKYITGYEEAQVTGLL